MEGVQYSSIVRAFAEIQTVALIPAARQKLKKDLLFMTQDIGEVFLSFDSVRKVLSQRKGYCFKAIWGNKVLSVMQQRTPL